MKKCLPFRWYGGKYSHQDWLLPQLPATNQYIEPYGGSATILLSRDPSPVETYNDRDSDVTNFFRVLRDQRDELLEKIALTPFSREEFTLAIEKKDDESFEDLERARLFFVRAGQVQAGLAQDATPGRWAYCRATSRRDMANAVSRWHGRLDHLDRAADRLRGLEKPEEIYEELSHEELYCLTSSLANSGLLDDAMSLHEQEMAKIADRLRRVQIENRDALEVIDLHDHEDALFYCDPPYPHSAREGSSRSAYRYEMEDEDHRELSEVLHESDGKVAISSYRCELMGELYGDWNRIDVEERTAHSGKSPREESLWLNYPVPNPDHPAITVTERL